MATTTAIHRTGRPDRTARPENADAALRTLRGPLAAAAVLGVLVNVLVLTGPIYMLRIYDQVLAHRSVETLAWLTALMVVLYLAMGALEDARGRIFRRCGMRLYAAMQARAHRACLAGPGACAGSGTGAEGAEAGAAARNDPLRDLDAVRRALGAGGAAAVLDLPWTPIFILAIGLFHPLLGAVAFFGAGALVGLGALRRVWTRAACDRAAMAEGAAGSLDRAVARNPALVRALGAAPVMAHGWKVHRLPGFIARLGAEDTAGTAIAAGKTLRLMLQSLILGTGAYLVLRDALSVGAIFACSILLGRALVPVESAIAQLPALRNALAAWRRLARLEDPAAMAPARPRPTKGALVVRDLTVFAPGRRRAALRLISFTVQPGQAMGVIGRTGAGKSALACALTGQWAPAAGLMRLGNATLPVAGTMHGGVGYLPQQQIFFDGTIAQNIAGFAAGAGLSAVETAAKASGAHDLIAALPEGYDTYVRADAPALSMGALQQIALARALFHDPQLLVLDEPASQADADGIAALERLTASFRAQGKSMVIMTHRPTVIARCDTVLLLENGRVRSLGPPPGLPKTNGLSAGPPAPDRQLLPAESRPT
ncbi:type I secretion system permease/ATPase [Brevirhabdus sp.]|uniref:type I secretion system permease/ATPase n=1 Tax=Brevirhabdus sp. TaxID=2004514 RepID=UPI0040599117